MKKILTYILMIAVTGILVTGCDTNVDGDRAGYSLDSFKGGDKALDFSFSEDSPPELIRDQGIQPFSIRFDIDNEGEFDIPEGEGHVALRNIDYDTFNVENHSKEIGELVGYRRVGGNELPGGSTYVSFTGLSYNDSIGSGSYTTSIYGDICYPYNTTAVAELCVSGDPLQAEDELLDCNLNGENDYSNSGAPVKIENVEQSAHGQNSISFQFDIVHEPQSDNSKVFERGSTDSECRINGERPSSAYQEEGKVEYSVDTGIEGLDCETTGQGVNQISLGSNERHTVSCVQDTSGEGDYGTPIQINLAYDYWERESEEVTIEHTTN